MNLGNMNNSQQLQNKRPQSIQQLLIAYKSQIAVALPKHLNPDRMARIALTVIRKNPKLLACDSVSLFGAIIQASQLGLEIGPGGAHLVPYGKEVQMIPDYRGLMGLARNSGDISTFYAKIVRENDVFDYEFGSKEFIRFKPAIANRGVVIGAFAYARFTNGHEQFDVMSEQDIDEHRQRSKAKDKGPWVTDYDAMAMKTVIRRICKFLPVSAELQKAITLDELNDSDIGQNNRAILDGEFEQENEPAMKPDVAMPKAKAAQQ